MSTIPAGMVLVDAAGHWLNPAAAAALERAIAAGCPVQITSAGRTVAEQLELIYLHAVDPVHHAYAAPISGPSSSEHIAGNAIDTGNSAGTGAMQQWLIAHPSFGFIRTAVPVELWHFAYRASFDQYPTPPVPEEDIVATLDQLNTALATQLAPLKAGEPLYRPKGRAAAYRDLGAARRWISAAQYASLIPQPTIVDLDPSDPFWTLPVVGADTTL